MNEWLNKLFDNPNWQGADQLAIYKAQAGLDHHITSLAP